MATKMTKLEEAKKYYEQTVKDLDWFYRVYSDKDIESMYDQLCKSKALFDNETARIIKRTANDRGEWETSVCLNAVNGCNTETEVGKTAYFLTECYRRNGSSADVNFRLGVYLREDKCNWRRVAQVKIPYNASERVVRNRIEKLQNMIKRG